MAYRIEWDIRAYKELKSINNQDALALLNSINKLYDDPRGQSKLLEGKFKGKYRIRVGDYRVIYWIKEDENTIFIVAVGYRRNIYREK